MHRVRWGKRKGESRNDLEKEEGRRVMNDKEGKSEKRQRKNDLEEKVRYKLKRKSLIGPQQFPYQGTTLGVEILPHQAMTKRKNLHCTK